MHGYPQQPDYNYGPPGPGAYGKGGPGGYPGYKGYEGGYDPADPGFGYSGPFDGSEFGADGYSMDDGGKGKGGKARWLEPSPQLGPYPFSGKFGKGGKGGRRAGVGCNIYVYNIPLEWDEEELARHFHHCGELVSVSIMRKPETDESRGFGFVGFSEASSVRDAILAMDGFCANEDKYLNVNPKKGEEGLIEPFSDVYPPAARLGEVPEGRAPTGANVYIYNIPHDWSEDDLYRHFIHYGCLFSVKLMTKEEEGQTISRGFGFASYVNPVSALRALVGMNGFAAGAGKNLVVQIKQGEEEAAERVRSIIALAEPAAFPGLRRIEPRAKSDMPLGAPGPRPKVKDIPPGANLYVGRAPANWSDNDLRVLFSPFGNILSAALVMNPDGTHKAYGFVGYDNAESADLAIQNLNGAKVGGKSLIVKLKDDRSKPF